MPYHPSSEPKSPAGGRCLNFLIADADSRMANLIAGNLRTLGYRVAGVARTGNEAVNMALMGRPDIVIMDINLPPIDGIRAARQLLKYHHIPIVLTGAGSDTQAANRAGEIKAVGFLAKPFTPGQLKAVIQIAVAGCEPVTPKKTRTSAASAGGGQVALGGTK